MPETHPCVVVAGSKQRLVCCPNCSVVQPIILCTGCSKTVLKACQPCIISFDPIYRGEVRLFEGVFGLHHALNYAFSKMDAKMEQMKLDHEKQMEELKRAIMLMPPVMGSEYAEKKEEFEEKNAK